MISLIRKSNWPQTSICRKIDRHTNALCNMSKNLFLHFEYLTNYILPSHWFIQKLDKVESMNKRWKNTFGWYAAWTGYIVAVVVVQVLQIERNSHQIQYHLASALSQPRAGLSHLWRLHHRISPTVFFLWYLQQSPSTSIQTGI